MRMDDVLDEPVFQASRVLSASDEAGVWGEPALSEVEAVDDAYPDYENAVSFLSAAAGRCDLIVTRNPKDFMGGPVRVMTPAEFLSSVK